MARKIEIQNFLAMKLQDPSEFAIFEKIFVFTNTFKLQLISHEILLFLKMKKDFWFELNVKEWHPARREWTLLYLQPRQSKKEP